MSIRISREGRRGCGFRKAGAMYLVCDGPGFHCGALPIPLGVCPTCHGGIKPTRGFTWIDLENIRAGKSCVQTIGSNYCDGCPLNRIGKAGLIWVGEAYYKTPTDFNKEAAEMGISRRISAIPKDFRTSETWIALAHRKAITSSDVLGLVIGGSTELKQSPGIFHVFRPSRIEYIIKATDSKKKLEGLEKRGLTLVKIETDQTEMEME
jgi:hypothetical protein